MPRYSSPQRNSSGPQNDLIEKEAQADSFTKSIPDLRSMGNETLQEMLAGSDFVEIPLQNSHENMSDGSKSNGIMSNEGISPVIGSDQENENLPENDRSLNLDDSNIDCCSDSNVIDTGIETKQREL